MGPLVHKMGTGLLIDPAAKAWSDRRKLARPLQILPMSMDLIARETIAELVDATPGRALSLFLPTHRAGPDSRPYAEEDVIRWKNQLREAEAALREAGASSRETDEMLAPARARIDDVEFWQHQSDGLAAFAAPGQFRTFRVPLRLDPLVVVSRRFHVTPLVPLLTGDGVFYILALSQGSVRLFQGTRQSVHQVRVPGMPANADEALRFDVSERQLQYRSVGRTGGGRRTAMFHGHVDDTKENILRLCQQVDRAIAALLHGSRAPVVLAAVEYVAAIYRLASSLPRLLDEVIPGNPDDATGAELHARALPIVEPILHRDLDDALARYHELVATNLTTRDLARIVVAAHDGQIDVVFVERGPQIWGSYNPGTREITIDEERRPESEDLLNMAAVRTILTQGSAFVLEPDQVPGDSPVAALLRYP
jgi:hypothetical protein